MTDAHYEKCRCKQKIKITSMLYCLKVNLRICYIYIYHISSILLGKMYHLKINFVSAKLGCFRL